MWRETGGGGGDREKGGRRCMGGRRRGGGKWNSQGGRKQEEKEKITTLGRYFAIGKMRRGGANKYRTGTQGMKGYRK